MEARKKATRDIELMNLVAAKISPAQNITDGAYICESNLIRVYAKTDVTIKETGIDVVPIEMPAGSVEYFQVSQSDSLDITGTANISSIL